MPWLWTDLDQTSGELVYFCYFMVCVMSSQRHRRGGGFPQWHSAIYMNFSASLCCSPWWSLHRLPLWIKNKCAGILQCHESQYYLKPFYFISSSCALPKSTIFWMLCLHFWECCGWVKFSLKGKTTVEKWKLVKPCLGEDLLSCSI